MNNDYKAQYDAAIKEKREKEEKECARKASTECKDLLAEVKALEKKKRELKDLSRVGDESYYNRLVGNVCATARGAHSQPPARTQQMMATKTI